MPHIVAVHTGAGNCSPDTNKLLKVLCKRVCNEVTKLLAEGKTATEAAVAGTLLLEDSPLTNAGLGSSITIDRKTRTEASICSTISGFHCAGDLDNVKHPIKIVQLMVNETMNNTSKYIPPRIMVGQSAVDRYSKRDSSICQTNICTKRSIKMFHKAEKHFNGRTSSKRQRTDEDLNNVNVANEASTNTDNLPTEKESKESRKIEEVEEYNDKESKRVEEEEVEEFSGVEDTVGVVCVDNNGDITCATSSGGSLYKYSGRLGQCCVHGAGSYTTPRLGIVTTGNGEQIINKLVAVTVANTLEHQTDVLSHCADEVLHCADSVLDKCAGSVLDKCFTRSEDKMCGYLAVQIEGDIATIHVQHTLTNMVVAFQSGSMDNPVCRVVSSDAPVFIQAVKM